MTVPSGSLCGFVCTLETPLESFALGTTEEGWKGTWLLAFPSRQRYVGHGFTTLPLTLSALLRILMEWAAWC